MRQMAQQHGGQQGHQGNVECSQKTGIGDRGELDADLLHRRAHQHQDTQAKDLHTVSTHWCPALAAQPTPLHPGQRCHHQRSNQKAAAREEQGANGSHALALRNKG